MITFTFITVKALLYSSCEIQVTLTVNLLALALFPQVPDQHIIYHNTLTLPQINLSSDLNRLIN